MRTNLRYLPGINPNGLFVILFVMSGLFLNPSTVKTMDVNSGHEENQSVTTVASDLIETPSVEPAVEVIRKNIVIDPGHGGRDTGIRSDNQLVEKEITLKIALAMKKKLGQYSNVNVYVTRSNDKQEDIIDRTVYANHKQADVFVSIHGMGILAAKTLNKGLIIYTSRFVKDQSQAEVAVQNLNQGIKVVPWALAQNSMLKKSEQLASRLVQNWSGPQAGAMMMSAPLAVLSGIHAPAVLLEIDFSNVDIDDQTRSEENKQLDLIAGQLAKGIIQYLF